MNINELKKSVKKLKKSCMFATRNKLQNTTIDNINHLIFWSFPVAMGRTCLDKNIKTKHYYI